MWNIDQVVNALSNENYPDLELNNDLALQLFDQTSLCGIGVDNLGRRVLVLPAQSNSIGFVTSNAIFDPLSSVTWMDMKKELPNVATLRCEANFRNKSICEAVAALFLGLINIQDKYGNAGSAIWEMKQFFENGFQNSFSEETLIGLFGELVIVHAAEDSEKMIQVWHSNTHAYFDFSSDNLRLEVKTSKSNLRNHNFSSNQIGSGLDAKTYVASIILSIVEKGVSLSDLLNLISLELKTESSIKLINIVLGTLGVVPESVKAFHIDLNATLKSVVCVPASEVPRPDKNTGVISMSWLANLDNCISNKIDLETIVRKL